MGSEFVGRDSNKNTTKIKSKIGESEVEQLYDIEFTSSRKCMSVIVKTDKGKLYILTKGADSVIMPRVKDKTTVSYANSNQSMEMYAVKGLRTLCIAYRELTKDELDKWGKEYEEINQRPGEKDQLIEDHGKLIEKDFELCAVTAIEDRLQDHVPETIRSLRAAGISTWVLTGDKKETAINIGYSCGLLENHMHQ
jgi:magnesium-transporting ATPase (P-type)